MSMNELVHSLLHSRLVSALRLPSFAGDGLPERMRSTTFALLGLTTAAGLALVAIFAQPGWPLLSPVPLPAEPSLNESISGAEKVKLEHRPAAVAPARPSPAREDARIAGGGSPPREAEASPVGTQGGVSAPADVDTPAPVGAPETSDGGKGGGGAGTEPGGGSAPVPAAAPEPAAAPASTPASTPAPSVSSSGTGASPELSAPSSSPPEPAAAPGNSSSAAAAGHASERGIEASASSAPSPVTSTAAPETSAQPGSGNGLAKGHDK